MLRGSWMGEEFGGEWLHIYVRPYQFLLGYHRVKGNKTSAPHKDFGCRTKGYPTMMPMFSTHAQTSPPLATAYLGSLL